MPEDAAPVDLPLGPVLSEHVSPPTQTSPDVLLVGDGYADLVELRMELDLAQLDHPSRWAKLSR